MALGAATAELRAEQDAEHQQKRRSESQSRPEVGQPQPKPLEQGLARRLRVLAHGLHQGPLQRLRRRERLDPTRQGVDGQPELLDLVAALGTARHVPLELRLLGRLQGTEEVGADVVVVHVAHSASSPISPYSCRGSYSSRSRIRPLTVPTGMSSISAIFV